MFCAFSGAPNIVRLHGRGVVPRENRAFPAALALFPEPPDDVHAVRAVIRVEVTRVSDSCGYSVPLMAYEGDRDLLIRAHERRDDAAPTGYRAKKNAVSIGRLIFEPEGFPAALLGP